MTAKQILSTILLLFAVGSAGYVLLGAPVNTEDSSAGEGERVEATSPEVIVYYMDMGKDCSTCLNLETYTHDALKAGFADALASGRIEWRTVDLDIPENEHFIKDFGLYTKSVVLVRLEGGEIAQFDSLSRIWELVYDKDAFVAYIQKEVGGFLGVTEASGG